MDIQRAINFAKQFGVRRPLKVISIISWFSIPFLIWLGIYRFLGQEYFVSSWLTMLGIGFLAAFILPLSLVIVNLFVLENRLMGHIEHAKDVFSSPDDPDSEKKFRLECHKFIVPYLYLPRLFLSGISAFFGKGIRLREKIIQRVVEVIATFWLSYSVMVFLIYNQNYLRQVYFHVAPYIPGLSQFAGFFVHNLIFLIAVVFLLSLYSDPVLQTVRKPYMGFSKAMSARNYSINLVSVSSRVLSLVSIAISMPWYIKRREKSLKYAPFIHSIDLPLIIEKAVYDIKGKRCSTSKWSYVIKDEKDIEILKKTVLQREEIPSLVRFIIERAAPDVTLGIVRIAEPTLFLGTIDEKCAILGRMEYNPDERIHEIKFFFDNRHLKSRFKSIVDTEIKEQERLKERLPTDLKEIISKLKRGNSDGTKD